MCSAASHVAEEQPDSIIDEMFVDSINWLIDSYKPELHNWEVNVGSKLDTLSLCVDAIMCFFDKLSASMQYAAFATVFQKILEYYILNDNIYETIAKHPLGRYAFDRIRDDVVSSQKRIFSKGKLLPSTHSGAGSQKDGMQLTLVEIKNKEQDEPYQKKVLGAIALYSSLVRIIAFTQKYNKNHEVSQEDNKSYESYKDLIIQKLKRFLAIFFDKDTSIIPIVEKINKIDTCMVPQIMYFIIQSFNEAHRALEDD